MCQRNFSILISLLLALVFTSNVLAEDSEYKELSSVYPLHFVGTLPGANTQMRYQLDIFENKTYFIRTESLKDGILSKKDDDVGRWYADNDNRVVLNGIKRKVTYFLILDESSIELMDLKGEKINSKLDYTLKLEKDLKTIEPTLFMSGVYSYRADAAILYECSTGLSFPVALEADNLALESAYLDSRISEDDSLKVELEVKISDRKTDHITKATIIVEEFLNIIPKEKCQNPYSKAKLQNTYWKLTRLNSKPLPISKTSRREAHMILDAEFKIKGNSGCNSFNGKYEYEENKLRIIGPMMMTRMFCRDSDEGEFMKALESMKSYKIQSEYLEIFDSNGTKRARFESVYLY